MTPGTLNIPCRVNRLRKLLSPKEDIFSTSSSTMAKKDIGERNIFRRAESRATEDNRSGVHSEGIEEESN